MSLKNDLMYPFGNPFKEHMTNRQNVTALNNVLKLARDKIRVSKGDMEEILLTGNGGGSADDALAEQSVQIVEEMLQYLNAQKEEENTHTP